LHSNVPAEEQLPLKL